MRRFKKSIVLGVVVLLLVGLGVYLATDAARQRAIVITGSGICLQQRCI